MSEDTLQTICGLFCGSCTYLGNGCEGCDNVKGKPFWTDLIGVGTCPIYDCCVNIRHLGHCGQCSELLCDRYSQVKDPVIPDQQIEKINLERKNNLIKRAKKMGYERSISLP
jgi:hypothetical protein